MKEQKKKIFHNERLFEKNIFSEQKAITMIALIITIIIMIILARS